MITNQYMMRISIGSVSLNCFSPTCWVTFGILSNQGVDVAGKTSNWFCWLARLSCQHCQFYQAFGSFVKITCHTCSCWQPCCSTVWFDRLWQSDLITLVRQVTPLCSFYMDKPHPTKVSYPDGLGGVPQHNVKTMKKKNDTVRVDRSPHQSRRPHLPEVPHFHVNRSLILGVTWYGLASYPVRGGGG